MIKGFFGVNIAVRDLDEAMKNFEILLGEKPRIVSDPSSYAFPGISGATFDFRGVTINLLTSVGGNNPVEKFLASKGEGVLLISLLSDDIETDIGELNAQGIDFVAPQVFAGAYGKVNFIHPKKMNGVQIEVIEPAQL